MKKWIIGGFMALTCGGGLAAWLTYFAPSTIPPPELSEQSIAYYAKQAEERNARVETLRQKAPPFAYTLAENCTTNWINFEGKRVMVIDKTDLSCGERCLWEPLGVFIPEDRLHYYEGGMVKAYPTSEGPPEVPSDCFPPVDGVCAVSTPRVQVGEVVTFQGFALGGSGFYVYSWSGDEGKSSQTRELVTSFAKPGRKAATVRITSNGQSIYKTCEVIAR